MLGEILGIQGGPLKSDKCYGYLIKILGKKGEWTYKTPAKLRY